MEVPADRPPQAPNEAQFPWRGAIFAAGTVALIVTAIALYNTGRQIPGLAVLGFGFALPMVWVLIAAREATSPDSVVRRFIPRMIIWLAVGSAFLGMFWWNVDRRISFMEAGFGAFYIVAGMAAIRIFDAQGRRPNLQAVRRNPPRGRHTGSGGPGSGRRQPPRKR